MSRHLLPNSSKLIPTLESIFRSNGLDDITDRIRGVECEYSKNREPINIMKPRYSLKMPVDLNLIVPGEDFSFFENNKIKKIFKNLAIKYWIKIVLISSVTLM
ncbi:hypothetical protein MKMG_01339 [Methanogenium sp. MK-MG]|nr:hypothetical protein MKMG_01339 [Methanogenium sp. MK-MG]